MKKNLRICDVDCFMHEDMAMEHQMDIQRIKEKLNIGLINNENYDGFDLCDVGANGIQIRLLHKQISGYTFGDQYTILYDWSNVDEVVDKSIKNFIENDNESYILSYKRFLADGEKYGWD